MFKHKYKTCFNISQNIEWVCDRSQNTEYAGTYRIYLSKNKNYSKRQNLEFSLN